MIRSRTYLHIARFKGKDVIKKPSIRSEFIEIVEKSTIHMSNSVCLKVSCCIL
jgi:hypothetical protein